MEDYGVSGTWLNLLINSPIQFSGYLISWRFYHRNHSSSCDSYAATWNPETDSNNNVIYRLVNGSETFVTSDSQSGVYNVSITDRIVRVSQGDIISIHVSENPSNCQKNWVSFRNNYLQDPLAKGYKHIGYPLPHTLPNVENFNERRAVAIQAYVEGENLPSPILAT